MLAPSCKDLESKIGSPQEMLTGDEVLQMRRPTVYAWIRNGEVLYIGRSIHGAARPLEHNHHRIKDILPTDFLYIWQFVEDADAIKLEISLIADLHPPLNRYVPSVQSVAQEV